MERPGWIITDNFNRQDMDHSFCRPPTSVFLLLESLFHFRPFLLSCCSGRSDVPVHTKWKIEQCTCSKSGVSGRHLVYFPMKCLQINQTGLRPFLSKKGGKISCLAGESQFKGCFSQSAPVQIPFTLASMPQTSLSPETPLAGQFLDSPPEEHHGTGRRKKNVAHSWHGMIQFLEIYIKSIKTQRMND